MQPRSNANLDFRYFLRAVVRRAAIGLLYRLSIRRYSAIALYRADPILHWQDLVCREFIRLRPIDLPFVAIDVAQTIAGEWIVIECNDAQESGYGAVSPFGLWQNIIRIERELGAQPDR